MRLRSSTLRALEEEAARYRAAPRSLAEEMIEESVKMRRHPRIMFIDRGGGRSAVLARYPRLSVWQVILTVRASHSLEEAARYLAVERAAAESAIAYEADYPDEVAQAIAANEAAFERLRRLYPQGRVPVRK